MRTRLEHGKPQEKVQECGFRRNIGGSTWRAKGSSPSYLPKIHPWIPSKALKKKKMKKEENKGHESISNPPIFGLLFHSYESISFCFSLFHNELQQTSHNYSYISNSLILYSYQVTTMRIILNYYFIFARFICNGQIYE